MSGLFTVFSPDLHKLYIGTRAETNQWLRDSSPPYDIKDLHVQDRDSGEILPAHIFTGNRTMEVLELVREAMEVQDPNAHAHEIAQKIVDLFRKDVGGV